MKLCDCNCFYNDRLSPFEITYILKKGVEIHSEMSKKVLISFSELNDFKKNELSQNYISDIFDDDSF